MFRSLLAAAASLVLAAAAFAQPTAFTYQGQLKDGVNLAEGQHDFRFRLFDAVSGGTQLGTTQCVDNILVKDGVFTTTIDFGNQFAAPTQRFIEIEVRRDTGLNCSNTTGYTTLAPRQPITPAPTATQAASAFSLAAPDGSPAKAVFVSNDGNVGIGTTSPATSLDVQAPTSGPTPGAGVRIRGTSSGVANQAYMDFFNSVGTRIGYVGDGGGADNSIYLQSDSGNIALNTAVGTTLTATPSGNVGIGTTTPGAPLHIASRFAVLNLQDTGSNSTQAGYVSYRNGTGTETAWIGFGTAGNPDFSIVNARSSGDIILNAFNGNVGIGTSSPIGTLNVRGKLRLDMSNNFFDNMEVFDPLGRRIWRLGNQSAGDPALSMLSPETGDFDAGMYRAPGTSTAVLVADVKNFRAPNPADPTTDIWYCCPEGPEAAMYIRGTGHLVNGRARVALPDHFRNLATEAGMTVQLTPLSADSKGLAVTVKRLIGIEVVELAGGRGDYEFDWRVEAVRRGYENYQVVRPWMRSDADEAKAWQNRLRSIEQRRSRGLP